MLSKAHPSIAVLHADAGVLARHLGRLLTPRDYARAEETLELMPVAADNRAFAGWHEQEFERMLDAVAGLALTFVVAPDVVGSHERTLDLWHAWAPRIRDRGLVPAFVLQDGWTETPEDAGAAFLGGGDEFKLGPVGAAACQDAIARGLWLHVGRVNSAQRTAIAGSLGASSFDGTGYSRFSRAYLRTGLQLAAAPAPTRMEGIA